MFVGRDFVLTVRHSETPDLAVVRRRMESDPGLLARGPEAVLYAILDAVVDGYAPVVAGLHPPCEFLRNGLSTVAAIRRGWGLSRGWGSCCLGSGIG